MESPRDFRLVGVRRPGQKNQDQSSNRGEIDYPALKHGEPQAISTNPGGQFQLFRIGDAVAARNIHAAIYDGLRLCKDF